MKKNKLLFFIPLSLVLVITYTGTLDAVETSSSVEEPPIAVIIKTPVGQGKGKIKKKVRRKVAPIPQQAQCPECPKLEPVKTPECPAPAVVTATECPVLENCALTVPEAEAKKNDINLSLALTFSSKRYSGLNQFAKDSWLTSPLSAGFMVGADYYPTESLSFFTDYSLTGTAFADAQPGIILVQDSKTTSRWTMGAKYEFSKYFSAKGYFGLRQDYSLYINTIPYAVADEFWHGLFGLGVGYNIWQGNRIRFEGTTGFEIYFPGSKTAFTSNTGININTELRFTLKYKPAFFIAARYEFAKMETNTFTEQTSSYYMFALGINFRSKFLK